MILVIVGSTVSKHSRRSGVGEKWKFITENYTSWLLHPIPVDYCGTSHALVSPYSHDIEFHHTPFTSFQPIITDYLHSVITKCAPKSCELYPIPTSLPLECLDAVLPTMTSIINDSLKSGVFPSIYKFAIVTPLLKKPSLDPNDLKKLSTCF